MHAYEVAGMRMYAHGMVSKEEGVLGSVCLADDQDVEKRSGACVQERSASRLRFEVGYVSNAFLLAGTG